MTRRAFTLVELVLALAVLSVLGLTLAGVAVAVSSAVEHTEEYHHSLQSSRVGVAQLQRDVRTRSCCGRPTPPSPTKSTSTS